ncbi:hypothetical protein BKE56_028115 [Rhodococcus sp. M8]|nr:hypothetical protein BKE56_028115 [Rhodococcus sp. M8]
MGFGFSVGVHSPAGAFRVGAADGGSAGARSAGREGSAPGGAVAGDEDGTASVGTDGVSGTCRSADGGAAGFTRSVVAGTSGVLDVAGVEGAAVVGTAGVVVGWARAVVLPVATSRAVVPASTQRAAHRRRGVRGARRWSDSIETYRLSQEQGQRWRHRCLET